MRKRSVRVFGVLLLILMMAIPSAYAAPNTNRGFHLDNTNYDGLRVVMSTMVGTGNPPAFSFPAKSPDVLQMYATQIRPKGTCVVAAVWHVHQPNSGTTTHTLEMSNNCSGGSQSGTVTSDLTNATFRGKYVRTITYNDTGTSFQDEVIDVRVVKTNAITNQWTAYIFNYNTGVYDFIFEKSGTIGGTDGYVSHGDGGYSQDSPMSCPTLYPWSIMEARGIQKRVNGVWSFITSSDLTGSGLIADTWPCLNTSGYQQVTTLPHFKIEPYGATY